MVALMVALTDGSPYAKAARSSQPFREAGEVCGTVLRSAAWGLGFRVPSKGYKKGFFQDHYEHQGRGFGDFKDRGP